MKNHTLFILFDIFFNQFNNISIFRFHRIQFIYYFGIIFSNPDRNIIVFYFVIFTFVFILIKVIFLIESYASSYLYINVLVCICLAVRLILLKFVDLVCIF